MAKIKRIHKFFKDELVFIIGSFIIVAIPAFFIVSGFLSIVNTTRNGIGALRGYMAEMTAASVASEYGSAPVQESWETSISNPLYDSGGVMTNITEEFAILRTSEENLASLSPAPYAAALALWVIILLIRFLWWARPKKYYSSWDY